MKRLACLVLFLGLLIPLAPVPAHAARTLGVTPGNAVAREPVTVSATVPGRTRRPVVLQRKQGSRWVAIARKRTSPRGKVAFRVTTTAMTVRVQAPRVRSKRLAAWTSRPRRIDPRVPRSFVVGRATVGASAGMTSEFGAEDASISANGRWVAFSTFSSDVVAGDANGHGDVFVQDLRTGDVEMISWRNAVGDANGDSFEPVISADGGSVAFTSTASNLVLDTNAALDVFVWDRSDGDVERVSVGTGGGEVNGDSFEPTIAEFGNVVAFTSAATNLTATSDANAARDVFVRARGTGQTTLVSRTSSGAYANDVSGEPSVSRDGRWIAFTTEASDIAAGDTNSEGDVVRRPLFMSGAPRLIGKGNAGSSRPSISGDGSRVAFMSRATNLVGADRNTRPDIYLWEARTGRQTLLSAATDRQVGDSASDRPAISTDGRFVAFESYAANLAPGDSNGILDVFVRNVGAGVTSTVSAFADGTTPVQESRNVAINGNGDLVAYESGVTAFDSDDNNSYDDVYVCRRRSMRGMS